MFWVKTAFRVGWDTSFQPQGWATSSTATLSFWGRESKGDQKESDRAFMRSGLGFAKDNEEPQMKAFGTVSTKRLFCLFHCLSVGARETRALAEVCHCWHRRGRTSGAFSSATATGSTSAVSDVCLEEVPGGCICFVSWTDWGRLCVCALSSGSEIIEQNMLSCFVYPTDPLVWADVDTQQLFLFLFCF